MHTTVPRTPHLRLVAPDTVLKRAMIDLANLCEDRAPKSVIAAARAAIDCHKCGIDTHQWAKDVLRAYAARNQRQDRYGK